MEAVRQYIDANRLMAVLSLPDTFRNRRLEVIIRPVEEQAKNETATEDIVQSLIGAIPYTDLSLSELREERLGKYEIVPTQAQCPAG